MPYQTLTVYDNLGRPVQAHTLVDSLGNDIINPQTGQAYVAPLSYSVQDSIDLGNHYRTLMAPGTSLFPDIPVILTGINNIVPDFRTSGPQDLQRTYNNVLQGGGNEFVAAFTDVASFHYGMTLRAAGFDADTALIGGGALNRYNAISNSNINTSGEYGINPDVDEDVRFGAAFYESGRWGGSPTVPDAISVFPFPCFAAGTAITLANGTSAAIDSIRVGDVVAAFDERDANGTGALVPARVTRLIPGVTTEWIVLEDGTRVTPGHRYLRADGTFAPIKDILADDGLVVDIDGQTRRITGTLLRAEDTGSDATWITPDPVNVGGTLHQPAPVLGWRTYNFTVEGLHTYVAGGTRRVYQDSSRPQRKGSKEGLTANVFADETLRHVATTPDKKKVKVV